MREKYPFHLYGDEFNETQILQWYKEEEEAYADLYGKSATPPSFQWTNLDMLFGYGKLPQKRIFKNALGFGAAWGYEFLPIINRLEKLTIIESSEKLVSKKLGNIIPNYVKSNYTGTIDFQDDSFDLITCFSCLHHIPNVSFVFSELLRVLKPGGYLLCREPINSMELHRPNRHGLTPNERGIPYVFLKKIVSDNNCRIVHGSYHHFIRSFLVNLFGTSKPFNSKFYLRVDYILSVMFSWNIHYESKSKFQRVAPQSCYLVITK